MNINGYRPAQQNYSKANMQKPAFGIRKLKIELPKDCSLKKITGDPGNGNAAKMLDFFNKLQRLINPRTAEGVDEKGREIISGRRNDTVVLSITNPDKAIFDAAPTTETNKVFQPYISGKITLIRPGTKGRQSHFDLPVREDNDKKPPGSTTPEHLAELVQKLENGHIETLKNRKQALQLKLRDKNALRESKRFLEK